MAKNTSLTFAGRWVYPKRMLHIAFALGLIGVFSFPSPARAKFGSGFWHDYLVHATGCEGAINDTLSEGSRCLLGNGLKLVLDESLRVADVYGKRKFGEHFQVAAQLRYSAVSDKVGIEGDIDMVMPFGGRGIAFPGLQGDSSFFLQQGVTRSWDGNGSGLFRNDLRYGLVRRFRLSSARDSDIVGLSAFHLLNAERGHRVLMPAFDYTGKWGTGSFRWYVPTTGWRAGRAGYEERAIEGFELGVRFDVTTTIRLNTVAYRWRAEDGSNQWDTAARMDFDWRPHPWLKLGAGYDGLGGNDRSMSFNVALRIPLGHEQRRPAWEGLGMAAGHSPPASTNLWQPVSDIGSIRVATREISVSALVESARIKFLQDTVNSGGELRLQVVLMAPAPEDVRVVVRLVGGSGSNPAVPGEDFIDEPVEATIRQGNTTSSIISIGLLRNEDMQQGRSLAATVSMAS